MNHYKIYHHQKIIKIAFFACADALRQHWMEKAETFLRRSTGQKHSPENPACASGGTPFRSDTAKKPYLRACLLGSREEKNRKEKLDQISH